MKLDKKIMISLLIGTIVIVAGYLTWQRYQQTSSEKNRQSLPNIEGEMTFQETFKYPANSLNQAYQEVRNQHVTPETAAFLRNSLPTQNTEDFFDDEMYIAASYHFKNASEATVTVFWQGGQDVHEIKQQRDMAELTITNYAD